MAELVRDGEGGAEAAVLGDRAAPVAVADRAQLRQSCHVTQIDVII